MDTEKIVHDLGEHITRRDFLKQVGVASLAALLGLLGLPTDAAACGTSCPPGTIYYHGCCLCYTPGSAQSWPGCNGTNNQTQKTKWCWNATDDSCVAYQCCEYMNIGAPCQDPYCNTVFASYAHKIGSMPQP